MKRAIVPMLPRGCTWADLYASNRAAPLPLTDVVVAATRIRANRKPHSSGHYLVDRRFLNELTEALMRLGVAL